MGEIIDKTKGRIKQAVGDLTDDNRLKREGQRDEAKGKIEGAIEEIKGAFRRAARDDDKP